MLIRNVFIHKHKYNNVLIRGVKSDSFMYKYFLIIIIVYLMRVTKGLRSIPPMRAIGSIVRNPNAKLSGLANISLGRYMSQNKREENNWQVPEYNTNKVNAVKTSKPKEFKSTIECHNERMNNYNEQGDYGIFLHFKGLEFSNDTFSKSVKSDDSYYIKVNYENKPGHLFITTTYDIFEFEVVLTPANGIPVRSINQLFYDELYIPELSDTFNASTMKAELRNNTVIISYNKL